MLPCTTIWWESDENFYHLELKKQDLPLQVNWCCLAQQFYVNYNQLIWWEQPDLPLQVFQKYLIGQMDNDNHDDDNVDADNCPLQLSPLWANAVQAFRANKGGLQKKIRPFFIVFYYEGVIVIVTWDSEIVGPYFNVVVDAIGPETDFTLETNVKEWKKTTEYYFDSTI